ncbi:MAG TPA: Xaa-Pro peptidase family protein [Candidatus Acidoferrum sp.]|nr:Xaa-Pro peptidase family protein [Candidatus Acidoferrum sp.]
MDRLRLCFSDLRADAILVTHLPNILYLTGFSGSAALLLVQPGRSVLFTDSRYTFQARDEVQGARVQIAKGPLLVSAAAAISTISRRGRISVAYSPTQMTVAQQQSLARLVGRRLHWVPAAGLVEKLRAIKDSGELSLMRGAAELISKVFCDSVRTIKPGVTELDVAAEIEYRMKGLGASGPSFETIVASGARSAWAHACPTSKLLRKNDLVVLDQGAILRAYCSDMTRTVFLGRASAEVRRMYRAVLQAQEAAKSAIRPGVLAQAVDAAARQVLKKSGLARIFTHSTGHGLGLEVHEAPRLGRGDQTVLEEGMVVTVEPGVYVEGFGGIRIEDDVVVTSKGADDLTSAPRELLEL